MTVTLEVSSPAVLTLLRDMECLNLVQMKAQQNTRPPAPPEVFRKHTIEELFQNYSGERFQTELINPDIPVGREKW